MIRLKRRVDALEAKRGGQTFVTVMPPGMTEIEEAVFIASERRRLGVGENDILYCVLTGVPRAGDPDVIARLRPATTSS